MKPIAQAYRGMSLLVELNIDRLLCVVTILGALTIAAWALSAL